MKDLDFLINDPRVTVRRTGEPAPDGRCVVYWMQRAQRAVDNPALNVAIEVGNLLGKPVVAYFQLCRGRPRANLRHYHFLAKASRSLKSHWATQRRLRFGVLS